MTVLTNSHACGYNKDMKNYDVIILGAGPAGLTAGLYATRGGLKAAIVECNTVGGQASTAANIENYPGFSGINGFDLTYRMLEQCKSLGADLFFDKLAAIELRSPVKTVSLGDGSVLSARAVIIATGTAHRPLGLEDEDRFLGKGISYCATCDGALQKGKTVAVVGGGNTAAEEALYLEKLAAKVYLIHRRDALRADDILKKRIAQSNIEVLWDSVVSKLYGGQNLTEIAVKNVKTDALSVFNINCLFVAIGQIPNSEPFGLNVDEHGFILTDGEMRTSQEGVFAAGDVRSKSLRQVVTACADGAVAADSAIRFLMTKV